MAQSTGISGGGTIRWAAQTRDTVQSPCGPATGYGPDPSCQPCPDCGGLECLCRPRFFAGQLLTEQDLNRLDHYITEKHKLHNRHLFGAGVVCGMVVTCAPCDERVNVSAGYALSPCGEDIVVCKPDSVDICALIQRCREPEGPDCRPFGRRDDCEDVEEEWVLAVRYAEHPSMPQTPIIGPASCACGSGGCKGAGCACGGSCGCSPGSAVATSKPALSAAGQPRLRRGAAPTCEPTVTCEGYRYDVFRKPEPEPRDPRDPDRGDDSVLVGSLAGLFENLEGGMAANIACCLRELERAIPRPPGDFANITAADRQAWFRWCCAVRSSLVAYFTRVGGTDCEAIEKLSAVPCPSPDLPLAQFQQALTQSILAMFEPTLQAMLHCICTNILPPCPPPEDPRVPLAVVTIRKRDCHIVKVCNWTPLRRHVVTFPTLGYWLGWIPLRRIIREFMEELCCQVFSFNFNDDQDETPVPGAAPNDNNIPVADPLDQPVNFAWQPQMMANPMLLNALVSSLTEPSDEKTALKRGDLLDMVFRRPAFATSAGLDDKDKDRLAERIAGSGLVKTLAATIRNTGTAIPTGLFGAEMLSGAFGVQSAGGRAGAPGELAELRQALDAQAKEIAALSARLNELSPSGGTPGGAAPARRRRRGGTSSPNE
jgi:hypothetical protein